MSPSSAPDPFEETPAPAPGPGPAPASVPFDTTAPPPAGSYSIPVPPAGMPSVPGMPLDYYGGGGGVGGMYSNYNAYPSYPPPPSNRLFAMQQQQQQQNPSAMVQEAMARFARVSTVIDDVLRNLHMLFDAVFGLAYAVGAARSEARLWLAVKYNAPVLAIARVIKAASAAWRLGLLFIMSPMAGRFSPVVLVLRVLGLVPRQTQQEEEEREEEEEGGDVETGDGVTTDSERHTDTERERQSGSEDGNAGHSFI